MADLKSYEEPIIVDCDVELLPEVICDISQEMVDITMTIPTIIKEDDYEYLRNLPTINGKELKGDIVLPTNDDLEKRIRVHNENILAHEMKGITNLRLRELLTD